MSYLQINRTSSHKITKTKYFALKIFDLYPILYNYFINIKLAINTQLPILIYSQEKTGSSSFYRSIKESTSLQVFHHHYLYPPNGHLYNVFPKYYCDALYKQFFINKQPIKIISIVRNPIDRLISSFFFKDFTKFRKISHKNCLLSNVFKRYIDDNYIDWFRIEFYKSTNINIYNYEFLKNHLIIKYNNLNILIIKIEEEDKILQDIISEFLDHKVNLLRSGFRADNFEYNKIYQLFKEYCKKDVSIELPLQSKQYIKMFYPELNTL